MKYIVMLFFTGIILGCGGTDRPSKPDNLIPQEKMSAILYDVFLLNAAKGINKRVLEQKGIFPQAYIFEKYKIDSLQFALSNNYYSYDTKAYQGIMERVRQKIDKQKGEIDIINLEERKIQDSINAIVAKEKLMNIEKQKDSVSKNELLKLKLDSISPEKPKLKPQVFGEDE